MKFFVTFFVFICLWMTSVSAGEYYNEPEFGEVQEYDFDFEVELDGRKAEVEWNAYKKDDFKWYKLLRSSTNSKPVYPDDHVFRVITDGSADETYDHPPKWTSYYRLCVVTQQNDRLCSRVVKIYNSGAEYHTYDYKKKEESYDKEDASEKEKTYNKKYDNVQKKSSVKSASISSSIKTRLNNFVDNFQGKLDASDLSDSQKAEKIKTILERLEEYKDKKPSLKSVIEYLIQALEELHSEYSDELDGIEALFEL